MVTKVRLGDLMQIGNNRYINLGWEVTKHPLFVLYLSSLMSNTSDWYEAVYVLEEKC